MSNARFNAGRAWLPACAVASFTASCLVEVPGLNTDPVVGNAGLDTGVDSGSDASDDRPSDVGMEAKEADVPEGSYDGSEESLACEPGTEDCNEDPTDGCEDLTIDTAHCGACDHNCLGGACVEGRCQPVILATGVGHAFGMVKDAKFLYGSSSWGGSIWKVPVEGCADPAQCAIPLSSPSTNLHDIATDGDALFFTDLADGRVARVGKDGQDECDLATGELTPLGISVDDTYVYWCARDANAIKRASKTCGAPGTVEVLVAETVKPHFVRVDATGLYWTKRNGDLVSWATLDGTVAEALWQGTTPGGFIFAPALDDAWVYWRDGEQDPSVGAGRLVRAPRDRSGALEVVADDQPSPRFVVVDETHAYWTTGESVRRMPKDGGSVETLATGYSSPHAIVVDHEAIYFGAFWGEQVVRVAK